MQRIFTAICFTLLTASAIYVHAQVNPYKDGTPGVTGYRSEVLSEVIVQGDKFMRLAEAIPADKYTWRPAPDVRSFAEVFLHVTGANYNLYTMVGSKIPDGIETKNIGKSTTDKTKIVAMLKDSFAHAQAAIKAMPDADLEKSTGLVRGQAHRARRPTVHRSSRRGASGTVDRVCAGVGDYATVDGGCGEG